MITGLFCRVQNKLYKSLPSCGQQIILQKYIIIRWIHRLDKNQVHGNVQIKIAKDIIMNTSEKKCCGLDVHKETIFAAIKANGKAGS